MAGLDYVEAFVARRQDLDPEFMNPAGLTASVWFQIWWWRSVRSVHGLDAVPWLKGQCPELYEKHRADLEGAARPGQRYNEMLRALPDAFEAVRAIGSNLQVEVSADFARVLIKEAPVFVAKLIAEDDAAQCAFVGRLRDEASAFEASVTPAMDALVDEIKRKPGEFAKWLNKIHVNHIDKRYTPLRLLGAFMRAAGHQSDGNAYDGIESEPSGDSDSDLEPT